MPAYMGLLNVIMGTAAILILATAYVMDLSPDIEVDVSLLSSLYWIGGVLLFVNSLTWIEDVFSVLKEKIISFRK